MKPRYEIHSVGMPDVVETADKPQVEQRDRAAQALFAATEIVSTNKFETEFGRAVPVVKYAEYAGRYQTRFAAQVHQLTVSLSRAYSQNSNDLTRVMARLTNAGRPEVRDAWATTLRVQHVPWDPRSTQYIVSSAGPDKRFDTDDDMSSYLEVRPRNIVRNPASGPSSIDLSLEHDRGPFNGRAAIAGLVVDQQGAALEGTVVTVREVSTGSARTARADPNGQFNLAALPASVYEIQVPVGSETLSRKVTLRPRDRTVLSIMVKHEPADIVVLITPQRIRVGGNFEGDALGVRTGVAGGAPGGVMGGIFARLLPMNGRDEARMMAAPQAVFALAKSLPANSATFDKKDSGGTAAAPRVRSYFPEALYINPEIITDQNGVASISIPLADSITTWRMSILASTAHGALGSGASSIKVFQDFFVDLDLPVTLTQGDRVSIPVAVYNYAGARGDVSLQLQPDDWFSLVDDVPAKNLAVDSGRVGGSQFTLEAKRIGKFKLTLAANMKGGAKGADIVVREIEVIPNGREQTQVSFLPPIQGMVFK